MVGDGEISHTKGDHYYVVLLGLPSEILVSDIHEKSRSLSIIKCKAVATSHSVANQKFPQC